MTDIWKIIAPSVVVHNMTKLSRHSYLISFNVDCFIERTKSSQDNSDRLMITQLS